MTTDQKESRQLSAIMFTDIVGYTSLMQADEKAARRIRNKHRKEFEQAHKIFHGQIIQYFGDGTLSVFKSSLEAVKCAIQMQDAFQSEEPRVPLRIGLHVGDITFDATEVYGDGVNVASRIENKGVPGSVLISERLNQDLKNHPDITTHSLGTFDFKNVKEPMEVFAIKGPNLIVPSSQNNLVPAEKMSIAVLPFVNMSTDGENEFFCDGITEEIINALAKIDQLKVISRTSSFFFKAHKASLNEIAEKLQVSTIIEGSVRIHKDLLRITAQLIEVVNDSHLWSESWDRRLENIFDIQDEISLLIADKLREHFGHLEISEQLTVSPTRNLNAYEYYLKGKQFMDKWNPEDANKAITHFEEALKLDENLIEAHTGLADAYSFLAVTGAGPLEASWMKAHESLQHAKAIDRNNAHLNYMLANQAFFTEADFSAAMQYTFKSIASKPTHSEAQQFMSFLYMLQGDIKKAREHLGYAKSIDPLNQETQFYDAYLQYRTMEFDKAERILTGLLETNPKNLPAAITLCYVFLKIKKFDQVDQLLSEIPNEMIIPVEHLGLKCLSLILNGKERESKPLVAELESSAQEDTAFHAHSYLFMVYAVTGKFDLAFELLEKLFKNNSSILLLSFGDPLTEPIRNDPRYPSYHERIYPVVTPETKKKKKSSGLNPKTAKAYQDKVDTFIETEKPYLNPALSLRSLAEQVEIHPNQLSWLLNEYKGSNFNEFINHLRIEHFKQLVVDPENSHISLIGLAYESGFNSKTVFNTTFKKIVGMTPKAYQKSQS